MLGFNSLAYMQLSKQSRNCSFIAFHISQFYNSLLLNYLHFWKFLKINKLIAEPFLNSKDRAEAVGFPIITLFFLNNLISVSVGE